MFNSARISLQVVFASNSFEFQYQINFYAIDNHSPERIKIWTQPYLKPEMKPAMQPVSNAPIAHLEKVS